MMEGDQGSKIFINSLFGMVNLILWALAFSFILYEVIKIRTAQNMSVNFLLINLVGASLLVCYDFYGMFGEASYAKNTHWTDLPTSVYIFLACGVGLFLYKTMRNRGNEFNSFGIWVSGGGLLFVTIYLHIDHDLSNIMEVCSMTWSIMLMLSFVPQLLSIAVKKTTKGWSLPAVGLFIAASFTGLLKEILLFVVSEDNTNFEQNLNLSRVYMNFFVAACCAIFFFLHLHFKNYEVHQNKYLIDLDQLKRVFNQMNDTLVVRSAAV